MLGERDDSSFLVFFKQHIVAKMQRHAEAVNLVSNISRDKIWPGPDETSVAASASVNRVRADFSGVQPLSGLAPITEIMATDEQLRIITIVLSETQSGH